MRVLAMGAVGLLGLKTLKSLLAHPINNDDPSFDKRARTANLLTTTLIPTVKALGPSPQKGALNAFFFCMLI